MNLINRDVATDDVNRWLDAKKVREKKREANADQIDALIDAVEEGILSVNGEGELIHKLIHPVGDEIRVGEIRYKNRINISLVHKHLSGVKSGDIDGRMLAYVAAITSQPKALILGMDTEDYSIAQSIAVFFL